MRSLAKSTAQLPDGYGVARTVDLQRNKRELLIVNLLSVAILAVMVVIGALCVPLRHLYAAEHLSLTLLRLGVMMLAMVAYLVLHEAVHGVFMRLFGCGIKPTFGFTGMYAYAASRTYFNRRDYLIIGLSPVVIWGIVLLVLTLFLPMEWFWVVYFVQIMNISGAAGDFYVSVLMLRMPRDLLVQDDGVAMRIYLPEK